MAKKLKILLGAHHLLSYQGSELYMLTIAQHLHKLGHTIVLYSPHVNLKRGPHLYYGIRTVDNLNAISKESFDIAHVNQNITALFVREAFPDLPLLVSAHGAVFLENPLPISLGVSQYLPVSVRLANHLEAHKVPKEKITIFFNPIDSDLFSSQIYPEKLSRLLVISNKIQPPQVKLLQNVCKKMGLKMAITGHNYKKVPNYKLPSYIESSDLVFTLGRGALESLIMGRTPYLYDSPGGDGLVTPENIEKNIKSNFSGGYTRHHYSEQEILDSLETLELGSAAKMQKVIKENYSTEVQIPKLISLYHKFCNSPVVLTKQERDVIRDIKKIIDETRLYAWENMKNKVFSYLPF